MPAQPVYARLVLVFGTSLYQAQSAYESHVVEKPKTLRALIYMSILAAILLTRPVARSGEDRPELESAMELMMADKENGGYTIRPATDVPLSGYTEDLARPQVFEIIRPGMGPVTVGRLASSCGCLRVTMEKKAYAQDERALILVRNIKPTVRDGATYAFFVKLETPVKHALQYDIYVKSGPWSEEALAMGSRNPLRAPPRPTPPNINPPNPAQPNISAPTPRRPNISRPIPDRPNITPPTVTPPATTRPRPDTPRFGTPDPGTDDTADGPGLPRSEIVPNGQ